MGLTLGKKETQTPSYTFRANSSHLSPVHLPKRVILVRHGQSLGNLNEKSYEHVPDWTIPLTDQGIDEARNLGLTLKSIVGDGMSSVYLITITVEIGPILIYCSPYVRTKQTLKYIMESFPTNRIVAVREEPRISGSNYIFSPLTYVEYRTAIWKFSKRRNDDKF